MTLIQCNNLFNQNSTIAITLQKKLSILLFKKRRKKKISRFTRKFNNN